MGWSFPIVGDALRYYPTVNEKMSWGGNFIEVLSIPVVAIAFNIAAIVLFASVYAFYRALTEKPSPWAAFAFSVGMAGCLCGLIDRVFWGGSLDFLQIPGLFVFDLKDCFLNAALIVFVAMALRHGDKFDLRAYGMFLAAAVKQAVDRVTGRL